MKLKDFKPTGFICWDTLLPRCNAHFTGDLRTLATLTAPIQVVSGGDIEVNADMFRKWINPNVTRWYAQNATHIDKRLFPMPIFLPDKSHDVLFDSDHLNEALAIPKTDTGNVLCCLNPEGQRNGNQRSGLIYQSYASAHVNVVPYGRDVTSRKNFLCELRRHRFVLCPRGGGIDTHKIWEALYLGTIPIVQRSGIYRDISLPIHWVDSFDGIPSAEDLAESYDNLHRHEWDFSVLSPDWWVAQINGDLKVLDSFR